MKNIYYIFLCSAHSLSSRKKKPSEGHKASAQTVRVIQSDKHASWRIIFIICTGAHRPHPNYYFWTRIHVWLLLKARWDTFSSQDLNSLPGLFKMITMHEEVENSMKQTIHKQSTTSITVGEERKSSQGTDPGLAELDAEHSNQSSSSIRTAFWSSLKTHQLNILYELWMCNLDVV